MNLKNRPAVLLLGHYPLDRLDRAPKVRTWAMAESLAKFSDLTVISGTRSERRPWLQQFVREKGLKTIHGVYLEAATSTMTLQDWRFLRCVRQAGLPLAIYIRDAYQRFPDLYPPKDLKERVLAVAYALTCRAYQDLATTLFFPTTGLSSLFVHPQKRLLPPAGSVLVPPPIDRNPFQIVYVGANGPHDGVEIAMEAMMRLSQTFPTAQLILIMRSGEHPRTVPPCCRLVEAAGMQLARWLWSSSLALIPRPDTVYNRLALPVKLFDYLSHGLPIVTTVGSEAAKLVVEEQVGAAVLARPDAYADGMANLLSQPAALAAMRKRAFDLIQTRHNWDQRAVTVLTALGLGSA